MTPPPRHDITRPLRTGDDLLAHAQMIARDVLPRRRILWLTMLGGDDVPLPVLVPIEDVPLEPDTQLTTSLFGVVRSVLGDAAPPGSVTFLLERPGPSSPTPNDLAWGAALRRAARAAGVQVRDLFISAGHGVRPVTADDAVGAL